MRLGINSLDPHPSLVEAPPIVLSRYPMISRNHLYAVLARQEDGRHPHPAAEIEHPHPRPQLDLAQRFSNNHRGFGPMQRSTCHWKSYFANRG